MKKYIIISLLLGLLFPAVNFAQLTISGEIPPPAEYRHGSKTLADENQNTALFIDLRSHFNFDFTSKKVQYYLAFKCQELEELAQLLCADISFFKNKNVTLTAVLEVLSGIDELDTTEENNAPTPF